MTQTIACRFRMLGLALAALAILALPATAAGKPRDRNHDGIADRWAKKHGLAGVKRAARKDLEADGLDNLAEYRSGTHPRRADSDRDGAGDAYEDPDRDRVDNGNEDRERTHPRRRDSDRDGRRDGREDADRDRLHNAGEDDAGYDPIDPDSDGDGVKDGSEGAGRVTAFDGTLLTVRLFNGETVTGEVDAATKVRCKDESWDDAKPEDDSKDEEPDGSESKDEDDDLADEDLGFEDDDSDGEGTGDEEPGDLLGDEDFERVTASIDSDEPVSEEDDFKEEDDGEKCGLDAIAVGTVVRGASLDFGPDGTYFAELELVP